VVNKVKTNSFRTVDWEMQEAAADRALLHQLGSQSAQSTSACESGTVRFWGREAYPLAEIRSGLSMSTGELFGTTQSRGAVDDVLSKTPSREARAPTRIFTELPAIAAHAVGQQGDPAVPEDSTIDPKPNSTSVKPATAGGSSSPTSSSRSTQSKPDSGFKYDLEMALECKRQAACPGAFPMSRIGSSKSVFG
jgi:hypothetical protein